MPKKALLLGATGLVGRFLLDFLVESEYYEEVRVLGRRASGKKHPKLVETLINFDELDRYPEEFKVDHVFCTLGITKKKAGSIEKARKVEFEYPLKAAEMAQATMVEQFVIVSSIGANPSSKNYYFRTKGELEQALSDIILTGLHILRPALLLGPRTEMRLGEDIAKVLTIALATFLPSRYKGIQARTVAKFMELLAQKNQSGKHVYESEVIRKIEKKSFDFQNFIEKTNYRSF